MLSGSGTVTANGVSQPIVAGTRVRVAMGADGRAVGAPVFPQPYNTDLLAALPTNQLAADVAFQAPLTYAQINALMGVAEAETAVDPVTGELIVDPVTGEVVVQPGASASSGDAVAQLPASDGGGDAAQPAAPDGGGDSGGDDDAPPGLVDNPALGDDGPPGQTGAPPPGQAKKDE
jgi:hypothetical protein